MSSSVRIMRRAGVADVPAVISILEGASSWLRDRDVRQWPKRFAAELVQPAVQAGETWLVEEDHEVVATVTLDFDDPAWEDLPDSALYLHRMAVSRHGRGLGVWILAWASNVATTTDREFVRLDCLASNTLLCRYYEANGFQAQGDICVGGSPGQRTGPGGVQTLVRRYQRHRGWAG